MTNDQKIKAQSVADTLPRYTKQELLKASKNKCMECKRLVAAKNIFVSLVYPYKGNVASNTRILCGLCYRDYHFDVQMNFYVFEEDCILEGVHDSLCAQ